MTDSRQKAGIDAVETATGGRFRRCCLTGAAVIALACHPSSPAGAEETECPVPGSEGKGDGSAGRSAAARLRDRDPLVREIARADLLYDDGRRDEAAAIYRKLAEARPDRRRTARRANLKLAQAAIAAGDLAMAESYVAQASGAGMPPDLRARAQRLRAAIGHRRGVDASDLALERVDALVEARQFDAAISETEALLVRPCPFPVDYRSRVKIRQANIYRARGEFAEARARALDARARATTEKGRERVAVLMAEIDAAERAAELRVTIERGNAALAAGDPSTAIAIFEPMLQLSPLPGDLDNTVRLRLARAYSQAGQHDAAIAVLGPLLASPGPLSAEDQEAAARIHLARADHLQENGRLDDAATAYRQLAEWQPPLTAEIRDSGRLGLARVLARRGDSKGALEQATLVREAATTPRLVERADNLLADIQDEPPLNRLVGYVQVGVAYDSNAPTLVSSLRDDDDDVDFPADRRFDDVHASLAARLEYRHQLGQGSDYIDAVLSGLRTVQLDLPQLDRTRIELQAGPVLALSDGTRIEFGGQFEAEWRGDRFRSSEPGAYVGLSHDLSDRLSASAVYAIGWHNDYRNERDGTDHSLDTRLRFDIGEGDVLSVTMRADREGAELKRFRNWGLLGGLALRHRWHSEGRIVPFIEAGGEVERVIFDGLTTAGEKRRDWKVRMTAAVGADIDRAWRARLHYSFFDLSSNVPGRSRLADHQVGLSLRYTWN